MNSLTAKFRWSVPLIAFSLRDRRSLRFSTELKQSFGKDLHAIEEDHIISPEIFS
jgi:hypothetical protein